jgi:hypothetical protein
MPITREPWRRHFEKCAFRPKPDELRGSGMLAAVLHVFPLTSSREMVLSVMIFRIDPRDELNL